MGVFDVPTLAAQRRPYIRDPYAANVADYVTQSSPGAVTYVFGLCWFRLSPGGPRLGASAGAAGLSTWRTTMGSLLNPYISFKDTARDAMEFYQSVFEGELTVNTFGEYGDSSSPAADLVMHAMLTTASGFTLMAADTPEGMDFTPGSQITISLSGDGDDAEAIRGYWEALSDGATVTVPLEKQVWGDEFGQITDRFGINWMVNIGGDAA
jgi:PhnB protein